MTYDLAQRPWPRPPGARCSSPLRSKRFLGLWPTLCCSAQAPLEACDSVRSGASIAVTSTAPLRRAPSSSARFQHARNPTGGWRRWRQIAHTLIESSVRWDSAQPADETPGPNWSCRRAALAEIAAKAMLTARTYAWRVGTASRRPDYAMSMTKIRAGPAIRSDRQLSSDVPAGAPVSWMTMWRTASSARGR